MALDISCNRDGEARFSSMAVCSFAEFLLYLDEHVEEMTLGNVLSATFSGLEIRRQATEGLTDVDTVVIDEVGKFLVVNLDQRMDREWAENALGEAAFVDGADWYGYWLMELYHPESDWTP